MCSSPSKLTLLYQSDICLIGTAFWNRIELIDHLTPLIVGSESSYRLDGGGIDYVIMLSYLIDQAR